MKSKLLITIIVVLILAAGALLWYVPTMISGYRIVLLEVTNEKNPPKLNGNKSSRAVNIAMNLRYVGKPVNLVFNSTCQNAQLSLKSLDGKAVPKITFRACGQAFTERNLKSGDIIEAKDTFDLDGFPAGQYIATFSYQDVLTVEKRVEIP